MTQQSQHRTRVAVTRLEPVAESVLLIELARPDGGNLPAWTPGAHIEMDLAGKWKRQYSLCGDPEDLSRWQVAVLKEPDSRGGSRYVHEQLACDDKIIVTGPLNRFEFVEAQQYLFIGGGIGITPLIPMIASAEQSGVDWSLVYGGRSLGSMSFVDHLRETYSEKVRIVPQDTDGFPDIDYLLNHRRPGEHVYCCGPEGLLNAVESAYNKLGYPEDELHMERFRGTPNSARPDDQAILVTVASTGEELTVGPQCSILGTLVKAGYEVDSSCEEGTCGSCELGVLAGIPEHRDSVLSKNERDAGKTIIVCVSRSAGSTLTLDL
ncbi:PDR/VanB family oxidoreductase [Arthrobacter sp. KNU40]|uniref:PDR/VanB family oxidoreductase n=1 Tax=Arthrobacter sp. KNU40 TaxID=3447965 RepID=UPI003F63D3C5